MGNDCNYYGEMLDGKKNGHGVFESAQYDYCGSWKDEAKEGKGVLIRSGGTQAWYGTWSNNLLEGEVIEVTLPDVLEARKAIFVKDKKTMQFDQTGVHRGKAPDGKVIKLTQEEIDGALEAVQDALQEITYLKEEAWPEHSRKIDALKVASDDLRA